jgi:hypothetical protein
VLNGKVSLAVRASGRYIKKLKLCLYFVIWLIIMLAWHVSIDAAEATGMITT